MIHVLMIYDRQQDCSDTAPIVYIGHNWKALVRAHYDETFNDDPDIDMSKQQLKELERLDVNGIADFGNDVYYYHVTTELIS